MATEKITQATTLKIRVETGTTGSGNAVYSTRSISHINPQIDDDDLYAIGNGFGSLQCFVVGDVQRVDSATLIEA